MIAVSGSCFMAKPSGANPTSPTGQLCDLGTQLSIWANGVRCSGCDRKVGLVAASFPGDLVSLLVAFGWSAKFTGWTRLNEDQRNGCVVQIRNCMFGWLVCNSVPISGADESVVDHLSRFARHETNRPKRHRWASLPSLCLYNGSIRSRKSKRH